MSKQLALHMPPAPKPYFTNAQTEYEKFVNKNWIENHGKFACKNDFLKDVQQQWQNMKSNPDVLRAYMNAPVKPYQNKNGIIRFFSTQIPKPKVCQSSSPRFGNSNSSSIYLAGPSATTVASSSRTASNPDPSIPNIFDVVVDNENSLRDHKLSNIKALFSGIEFLNVDGFLTTEIKNDMTVIDLLSTISVEWQKFQTSRKAYENSRVRLRKSLPGDHINKVDVQVTELKARLEAVAACKRTRDMTITMASISLMKQAEALKEVLMSCSPLLALLKDKTFFYTVNKRLKEQEVKSQVLSNALKGFSIQCYNDSKHTWDLVTEFLIDAQNSKTLLSPLNCEQLINLADIISSNVVLSIRDLPIVECNQSHIQQILQLFPVMFLSSGQAGVLINVTEFLYIPGALDYLLSPTPSSEEDQHLQETSEPNSESTPQRHYTGQSSLVVKFPEILSITTDFIKQHSFAAQHRRRTETCYSSGVSISQVRTHLLEKVPGLKEHDISLSTTRRLFEAPNKHRVASERYKGYIQARVGIKSNTYREYHEDAHYLFARNKFRKELATVFKTEVNIVSTDDMAKVKVGAPAVSRYHQLRKFFADDDKPDLPDHDFPTPGYLLNVSGYMLLEESEEELPLSALEDIKKFDTVEGSDFSEGDVVGNEPNENISILEALNMELVNSAGSFYSVLEKQLSLHMNINSTGSEIKECLYNEFKENMSYYTERFSLHESVFDDSRLLRKETCLSTLEILLTAFASVFCSQVVLVLLDKNSKLRIQGRKLNNHESPIFLAIDDDVNIKSLIYRKQSLETYKTAGLLLDHVTFDNMGRPHLHTPFSGSSTVYLRAQIFNPTTIVTHMTDIHDMLTSELYENKPGLFVMSDSGPDFCPTSVLNAFYFYRLFKLLDFDILCAFTYAARYSAYNCIEHLWAPLSNKLASVVFSNIAPGDTKPPINQNKLSTEERGAKEKTVFNTAMLSMQKGHWKDATFHGFPVDVKTILCGEDDLLFDDYELVKKFLKAPLRDMHEYSAIRNEYIQMFRHLDRHHNEIVIVKCQDRTCCKPFRSTQLHEFLKNTELKLPSPLPDKNCRGHYQTFLTECLPGNASKYGDDGQPSVAKKALGKCEFCLEYSFTSKTEKERHLSVFHRRQKKGTKKTLSFVCNFDNCGKMFGSSASLSRHKTSATHTARDLKRLLKETVKGKRKRKVVKSTKSKKRSLRQAMASSHFSSSSDSEIDSSEVRKEQIHECAATQCMIAADMHTTVEWIQCEECCNWFHQFCEEVDPQTLDSGEPFFCQQCIFVPLMQ